MNTDPAALTATGLALEWLAHDLPRPVEGRATDGSFFYAFGAIDLDYEMSYLLRIGTPDGGRLVSWLAIYQKHAPRPYDPTGLKVEWLNDGQAEEFGDQDLWTALSRWAIWTQQVATTTW